MMTDERFAHTGFFYDSDYYGGEIVTHNLDICILSSDGWRPFTRLWKPKHPGFYTVVVRSDDRDRNFVIHRYRWTGRTWWTPAGTLPVLRVTHYRDKDGE